MQRDATRTQREAAWHLANRRYLAAHLTRVRALLDGDRAAAAEPPSWDGPSDAPPALASLVEAFALTDFERDVLVLGAGLELEPGFAELCARGHRDPARPFPSFGLALAALPDPHWDAITTTSHLRGGHLVELDRGASPLAARYRVPERVWQLLIGIDVPDELTVRHGVEVAPPAPLAASHEVQAHEIAASCMRAHRAGVAPLIHLCGRNRSDQAAVAGRAAALLGLRLYRILADGLPTDADALDQLARIWRRDAILSGQTLVFDCHELETDGARLAAVARLVQHVDGPVLVMKPERRAWTERPTLTFEIASATADEQRAAWRRVLDDLDGGDPAWCARAAGRLAAHYDLDLPSIALIGVHAAGQLAAAGDLDGDTRLALVWDACRDQIRSSMSGLAQHIVPRASDHDLVLPEVTRAALADVELFVRHREVLDAHWGERDAGVRGRGTCVLFTGPSGVGKTFAAEVLATRLRLDLYRVDLSQIVSKYIGETEKNMRRLMDLAERGGSLLLFDEADSLFGKRTAVKDSHDRYANLETNYLLQRIETFGGLAILTSNLAANIDVAFQRRIRFVVEFAFPAAAERARLWQRAFPAGMDTAGLDLARLAQLNVSGAAIRSIAMHAALLAADDGGGDPGAAVAWRHVLAAARREYHKRGQPLTTAELAGWST